MRWIVALGALATLGVVGALSWQAFAPRGPQWPKPLVDLAAALGVAGVGLPDDWTLDKQPPEQAADLKLTAPVGTLAEPFASEAANAAWRAWREGRQAKALELAEKFWSALPAGKAATAQQDEERRLFAFLLGQLRWAEGKKAPAIAAARVAAGHPALGIAALRWVVARADEAGLSSVVLTLVGDRKEPGLRLARARALRRNGEYRPALAELDAIGAAKGTALARRVALERIRTWSAAGQEDTALAAVRDMLANGAKHQQAEEVVDWLIGATDAVWQKRLDRRPQDAAAVLDALVFTAQRRRYARAVPALAALAERSGIGLGAQCHARSWLAKCHDRKAEFDKSLVDMEWLRNQCAGDQARAAVRALTVDEDPLGAGDLAFRTGRALAMQGKPEGAAHLQAALEQGLAGLEADEARNLLHVLSNAEAREVLAKQGPIAAQDYAERDMIDVAIWRVALQRMIDKQWRGALDLLNRLAAARDRDSSPGPAAGDVRFDESDWSMGRAAYFAGRALWALDNKAEAVKRWQQVVRRHPLSYYAQMALAQLRASGQGETADLTAPVGAPASGPEMTSELLADSRVQRARKLGQLGWHDEAGEELDAAGLGRDADRGLKWQPGDPGRVWARAALDDEAGRWTSSHSVGRDVLRAYTTAWPHDGNRSAWKVAYPRGYQSLMDAAAKEFGMHPSVLYAICRAESGFNPKVVSFADAHGLLQLIVPTAKAMAKGLDIEANAETLKQPPVNVRLGARYLKKLFDRFEREQQMAAGYNAGGGAVGRWRKQRGDWPMDLFVETIPFRETRDYAKRVSATIAVYRNLYYGEPAFALALTQKAVPSADEPATEPSGEARPATVPAAAPAPNVEAEAVEAATNPLPQAPKAVDAKPIDRAKLGNAKGRGGHWAATKAKLAVRKPVEARPAKVGKVKAAKVKAAKVKAAKPGPTKAPASTGKAKAKVTAQAANVDKRRGRH